MADVACVRCGASRAGLERPPMPGDLGQRLQRQVCAPCWQEWKSVQVRIINEYRLSPIDPQHFKFLMDQMTTFLGLRD